MTHMETLAQSHLAFPGPLQLMPVDCPCRMMSTKWCPPLHPGRRGSTEVTPGLSRPHPELYQLSFLKKIYSSLVQEPSLLPLPVPKGPPRHPHSTTQA